MSKNEAYIPSLKNSKNFKALKFISLVFTLALILGTLIGLNRIYTAKVSQIKAVASIKEYMETFSSAYNSGISKIKFHGKTVSVKDGMQYKTKSFLGSDLDTLCKFSLKSDIHYKTVNFILKVEPQNTVCYDLYTNNGSIKIFRRMVMNSN